MKKISLIGAGWLGRPLALHWLQKGHQVQVTTTREDKRKELEREGLKSSCWTLHEPIPTWVQDCDVLVYTIPPRTGPKAYAKQAMAFFHHLKEQDFNGRILFCSSISVLGDEAGLIKENDECFPKTSSALNLREIEKGLKSLNFPSTYICRLGGLYGEERHPSLILAKKSEVLSGGRKPVNLIHLSEVIDFFDKLLTASLSNYEIFHVVNDIEASKSEFYPLCAKLMNISPIDYDEKGKALITQGKRISNAKIKNELSLSFNSCPLI